MKTNKHKHIEQNLEKIKQKQLEKIASDWVNKLEKADQFKNKKININNIFNNFKND